MFITFYFLTSFFLLIVLSPILIPLSFRGKYHQSIPARFFLWKNWKQKIENSYWFHGCSLGEINAMKPFIKELQKQHLPVSISTTTDTGFNSAKSLNIPYMFLPFEPLLLFWIKPQKKVIVLEAELWLLLFFIAKKRGAKTVLWSGRLSDRSFPKYLKMRWFYKKVFKNIDLVIAQSEIDRERFSQLGAMNIKVGGNIKLLKSNSKNSLNIPKDKVVIVGASTHPKDEDYILEAFHKYSKGRLIIVPRHKERFNDVWQLIKEFGDKYNYSVGRYSETEYFNFDIVLVDKIGMLIDIYAKSDIVILGGGFYDGIGGHNPVEPASFQNKIISGKYMFNQKELLKYISNIQIISKEEIYQALQKSEKLPYSEIVQDIDMKKNIDMILKI